MRTRSYAALAMAAALALGGSGQADDDSRGMPAWEVEVKGSDEGRIEVKVDKESGEILDMEHD